MSKKFFFGESGDYHMAHRAPTNDSSNRPAHDVEDVMPDFYTAQGFRYYDDGGPGARESYNVLKSIKGKPEALVWVYRAVPKTVSDAKINDGDWVALALKYAQSHGKSALNGKYKILKAQVKAKYVWNDGNSINEFGYDSSGAAKGVAMAEAVALEESIVIGAESLQEQYDRTKALLSEGSEFLTTSIPGNLTSEQKFAISQAYFWLQDYKHYADVLKYVAKIAKIVDKKNIILSSKETAEIVKIRLKAFKNIGGGKTTFKVSTNGAGVVVSWKDGPTNEVMTAFLKDFGAGQRGDFVTVVDGVRITIDGIVLKREA